MLGELLLLLPDCVVLLRELRPEDPHQRTDKLERFVFVLDDGRAVLRLGRRLPVVRLPWRRRVRLT